MDYKHVELKLDASGEAGCGVGSHQMEGQPAVHVCTADLGLHDRVASREASCKKLPWLPFLIQ